MGHEPSSAKDQKPEQGECGTPEPLPPTEIGGPKGPEPTRYGDWERNGRVSDF